MTLKRPPAKITPKRAFDSHCLTKRVEQFYLQALKRVLWKIRDNHVLC